MRSRWLAGVSMAFPIPSRAVGALPRACFGLAAGRCNFYSFPEKYGFPEKSERRIGEIAGSSPAITGRPTGTALVAIVPSVSTKGGFHHETQTRIGRGARRRPSRVRGAERGGEAHLHLQGHGLLRGLGVLSDRSAVPLRRRRVEGARRRLQRQPRRRGLHL